MNIVIVGASGYLGSALYRQLSTKHNVQGTYCSSPASGCLRFNMLTDDPASLSVDWETIDSVVLASGIGGVEYCAQNVESTRRLNVTAVSNLCDFAAQRNLHLTYLSTDFVYDGSPHSSGKPRLYSEQASLAPTTQYGQQKLDAEEHVRSGVSQSLIARLSMNVSVAGPDCFPFARWVDPLRRGEPMRLADDWIHCISWVNDTARAIQMALENKLVGIYNLCAPTFHSRFEWGLKTCEAIGADRSLISRCSVEELGFLEDRPRDLSLDVRKFHSAVPFEFTPPEDLLRLLSDTRPLAAK